MVQAGMEEDELDFADELEAALQLAPEVQLAIEQVRRGYVSEWRCRCSGFFHQWAGCRLGGIGALRFQHWKGP